MTEWFRKLGVIVPSWNTVSEYETWRMMPPGVSIHVSRIAHTEDSVESLDYMGEVAPDAAKLLAHAGVDAISYACTGASFYRGPEYEAELVRRIEDVVERPVVSMAYSLVEAARHLGLHRLAVGAPYEKWVLDLLVKYLEASGFTVLSAKGLGHQANILYSPEKALELAADVWTPQADGLLLSCSNFRSLEMIDAIEERLGKPVITSNQAAAWNLLRAARWPVSQPGAGLLFRGAGVVATG